MLHSTVIVIVCKLWFILTIHRIYVISSYLKSYEPGFLILFSHLQALLNGENHFCYLISNLSYKGGGVSGSIEPEATI